MLRVPVNASPRRCCKVITKSLSPGASGAIQFPLQAWPLPGVPSGGWVSSAWWGCCGDEPQVAVLTACVATSPCKASAVPRSLPKIRWPTECGHRL